MDCRLTVIVRHSPLTGIGCADMIDEIMQLVLASKSQSPDGDWLC